MITSERLRQRFLGLLRDHLLALIFFLAAILVMFYAATGALGQTVHDGFYSVSVSYDGLKEELVTSQPTVGGLLEEIGVSVGPLDIVEPTVETVISSDNFRVAILRGRYVRIIDGESQALEVTIHSDPRTITEQLGYDLAVNDEAAWRDAAAMDSLSLVPAIVINRANDYNLNIDGRVVARQAQSTSVGDILEELGHDTEDIAYVRPQLDQKVSDRDSIVVYYEKPDQEIIIETRRIQEGGTIRNEEIVYQVIYDPVTGRVKERNIIERYTSDQTAGEAEAGGSAETVSSSHRVGDLSAEQRDWLKKAGVNEADWFYVDYIVFRESRWQYWVWNMAGSSAYGLCQALPATKMHDFGEDYMTNPVTQLKWCDWYAHDRYDGWQNAYHFWVNNHWW